MKPLLSIKNLSVTISGKPIIRNLSLRINPKELHILMGPNGSGKSTLAYALLGHPQYKVSATELSFLGKPILKLSTDKRARLGMFLGFQYPLAVGGVSLANLMPLALNARTISKKDVYLHATLASKMAHEQRMTLTSFRTAIAPELKALSISEEFIFRNLNESFSGGEKKKMEILQMRTLHPRFAILDEPDSGLDVDALKAIAQAITRSQRAGTAVLLITHYQRILKYLNPTAVHILDKGTIVRSGTRALAQEIENKGYITKPKNARRKT